MARKPIENPWTSVAFGLTILACGIIFWFDYLGRIDASDYLQWWPVAAMTFGVAHLLQRQWLSGGIWVAIGGVFLLPLFGYQTISLWRIFGLWWLLFSIAGVTLMMQALRPARPGALHAMAVMGANVRRIGSQEFKGGDAIAVMGACELELGATQVPREAVLDVLAFWGGIDVRVPRGWRVVPRAITILGAVTDLTDGGSPGGPQLVIRGSVIMGGLEVRNTTEVTA